MSRHLPKKVKMHTGGTIKPAPVSPIMTESFRSELMKHVAESVGMTRSMFADRKESSTFEFQARREMHEEAALKTFNSTINIVVNGTLDQSFKQLDPRRHKFPDIEQMLDDINAVERTPNLKFEEISALARQQIAKRLKQEKERLASALLFGGIR